MSKHLERDLEALEQEILAQASLVEEMIVKACRALCDRRADLASELITNEYEINEREVRIEEECLKILALHQPVAVDLRRTATVLKINGDLERIADLAVNIAERTRALVEHPWMEPSAKLEKMVKVATAMVRDAMNAFVRQDAGLARDVCVRDDEVDDLNREIIGELCALMQDRSDLVRSSLHYFSTSRQIERVADHATNIAEDVIYLVEGEIARHHRNEARNLRLSSR